MTITVPDVQQYLNEPGTDLLQPNAINKQITLQTAYVNAVKKSTALTADIDNAILARCGWACYIAYTAGQHKAFGEKPAFAEEQVRWYKQLADDLLGIVADPGKLAEITPPEEPVSVEGRRYPVMEQIPSVDRQKFDYGEGQVSSGDT